MTATATPAASHHLPTAATGSLLGCGAAAGPLWAGVSLVQVLTRDGFDLTRHPLSALSNGSLGWLQITNFVLAGVLFLAGAAGLRRVLPDTTGGTWVPRLVRVSGIGMIAAGLLVMDPADGFPAGTPDGMPASMSWHSIGHMAAGTVTFVTLIATCFLLARIFRSLGRRGRSLGALLAGTALLAGDGWAMAGGTAGTLTLAVGATAAMVFVSLTAHWLRHDG